MNTVLQAAGCRTPIYMRAHHAERIPASDYHAANPYGPDWNNNSEAPPLLDDPLVRFG
jgi:hypothetical protein